MNKVTLVPRDEPRFAQAEVSFGAVRAQGVVFPRLIVECEARTSMRTPEYSIQPTGVKAEMYVGATSADLNDVVAFGEAKLPLNVWVQQNAYTFQLVFPLSLQAIKTIEHSLRSDYPPLKIKVTGSGFCSTVGQPGQQWLQWQETEGTLDNVSKTDWMKRVLEPVGWGKFAVLEFPMPQPPLGGDYQKAISQLERANAEYLVGDDRNVFARAFDSWDPFVYSRREELLKLVSDESKRNAIISLIESIRRWTNGGRHLPEGRKQSGGFEVDHIDAEFARLLVAIGLAYVGKRIRSLEQ